MLQVSAPEYKPEPELEVQVQRPNLKNEQLQQHIVKIKIGPTCKQTVWSTLSGNVFTLIIYFM